MNKNEVIKVNFDQGQQNLIRVSREFELSELKWLKSRVKSKGNGTSFELAESSSYPSSSYRGPTVFIFLRCKKESAYLKEGLINLLH